MPLQTQTEFGQSLNLTVATQVMKISGTKACFVKFLSDGKLIRRSFGGFSARQFRWADKKAFELKMLTGADIITHPDDCDREHPVLNPCNKRDASLSSVERGDR